jgi:2-phospho-L-lactate guanylyltransferase
VHAHALIPLKRLDGAKSRLAAALAPPARGELMLSLLDHVVGVVREAGIDRVTLVTAEPLDGYETWNDRGLAWNEALAAATAELVTEPCVAIVSADLPLLAADEIAALVETVPARGIAVARAEDGGTNAVAMRPPGVVATHFGAVGSGRVHVEAARAAGLDAVVIDLPGLAFDVDTPEHLARLEEADAVRL